MNLFEYVGDQIRDLRASHAGGRGISQEALAKELNVAANTISRWETATYKPSLDDLERLARYFGVSILRFFPQEEEGEEEKVTALLRVAKQLPEEDLLELQRYAEYRRARSMYADKPASRKGRKPKE